jgi:hypothetical protein
VNRVPHRMSKSLREELERIAGMCNNGESHAAGDDLERLLGYIVDHQGNRVENEDADEREVKGGSSDGWT